MAENKTRHLPPNAALAQAKYVRMTPMKCRRVIDLVRGLPVQDALDILRFDVHAASEPIYKVVASAIANAENNKDLDRRDLVVAQAYVDEGPTLKRFRRRGASIALEPANTAYEVRILPPNRVRIQGKLVGLFRRY